MAMFAPTNYNTSKYFLPPPHAGPSPPEEYLYGRSATQASPSANMPGTPPSEQAHNLHYRQLRPQRQPLYVPAALRPTEYAAGRDIPNPRLPDTPPTSQGNSFDNAKFHGTPTQSVSFDALIESDNRLDSELYRLSTREDDPADITGPPTTAHWKPDLSTNSCAVCTTQFSFWWRRHHCRRCGSVVCENCSRATVPLDQNARFHAHGKQSKACKPCRDEWVYLRKFRHSRASSIADQRNPVPAISIPQAQRLQEESQLRVGSMARSEGGMVWSTF